MMAAWYNCLCLNTRTLTDHKKGNLNRINKTTNSHNGIDIMIGPEDSPFSRPMYVELTRYHHLYALLAMIASYIDPTVKSLYR